MSQMKKDIATVVLAEGLPVMKDESEYGWVDQTAKFHNIGIDIIKGTKNPEDACPWVVPANPAIQEVLISEFMDTYNGSREDDMIQVSGVSCTCGEYTDTIVRYEGVIGDFIPKIFKIVQED